MACTIEYLLLKLDEDINVISFAQPFDIRVTTYNTGG